LNDISEDELDALDQGTSGVVSFSVPASWKKVRIPLLSDTPIPIDDPKAKFLRIDFIHEEMIPLRIAPPIRVFFPTKYLSTLNPGTLSLEKNVLIDEKDGIFTLSAPIFIRGASRNFVELVKDMIEIVIIAEPKKTLSWSLQINDDTELENRYVNQKLAALGLTKELHIQTQEEYYRNRFRAYLENFRLSDPKGKNLSLQIQVEGHMIHVTSPELSQDNQHP